MNRKMSLEERQELECEITKILSWTVGSDYAKEILEHKECDDNGKNVGPTLMAYIVQDVIETSAWEDQGYYSTDDVRLGIGRVLMNRLNISC